MVLKDSKTHSHTSNGISVPDSGSVYLLEIKEIYQVKAFRD
jgi:hypothetical protein